MRSRHKQGLTSLRRAHEFLAGREFTSDISALTPHVDALATVVARLEDLGREQDASTRAWRAQVVRKDATGDALRKVFLIPIARLARSIRRDEPLANGLAPVYARDHEGLLQAAAGMADVATQHKALFLSRGFTPDFVEQLRAATAGFRQAIVDTQLLRARRTAATAGMEGVLREARQHLLLIDALIAPRLAADPGLAAEWRSLLRVPRRATPIAVEETVTPEVKAA